MESILEASVVVRSSAQFPCSLSSADRERVNCVTSLAVLLYPRFESVLSHSAQADGKEIVVMQYVRSNRSATVNSFCLENSLQVASTSKGLTNTVFGRVFFFTE